MSEPLRHVHFVAIGGTGMGSLAGLLKARGMKVTGSDENLYPPMSDLLAGWGIDVFRGFRAENVLDDPADLVVIGNAVRPDNPEARAAIDEGLAYLSFPDALYRHAMAGKHSVVVSGTHGKTTTVSLIAALLHETGRDPSVLVAGHSLDFDGSFREGQGAHFVVEGDEYDTAFFDKTPKFLHYGAHTLILTSVEFDHADIYRDLEHVKDAFRSCIAKLPADGILVAAVDHPNVRDVIADAPCRVVGYGTDPASTADWCAKSILAKSTGTSFEVVKGGAVLGRAQVPLFGRFNVENALGALVAVEALGVRLSAATLALAHFRGVKRRQEIRGEERGVVVIDDFAHHPTAVRGSIESIRSRFPDRRLLAVFEPRTNTSRRKVFQSDYAEAFEGADRVVVAIVPESPIYSATGTVSEFFSAEQLASDLQARGREATAIDGVGAIVEKLAGECESGDVVLIMSNGAFDDIWQRLLIALRG